MYCSERRRNGEKKRSLSSREEKTDFQTRKTWIFVTLDPELPPTSGVENVQKCTWKIFYSVTEWYFSHLKRILGVENTPVKMLGSAAAAVHRRRCSLSAKTWTFVWRTIFENFWINTCKFSGPRGEVTSDRLALKQSSLYQNCIVYTTEDQGPKGPVCWKQPVMATPNESMGGDGPPNKKPRFNDEGKHLSFLWPLFYVY